MLHINLELGQIALYNEKPYPAKMSCCFACARLKKGGLMERLQMLSLLLF
jgi:hypothetical protein